MTITKVQAWIGIITGVLFIIITIGGDAIILLRTFEAYDARLAKLENAVKAINVNTPDEKYRELIKELMAEKGSGWTPAPGQNYLRFDSTTHSAVCSRNGGAEVPCEITDKQAKELGMRFGKSVYPADSGASADAPATKPPQ